MSKPMYKAKNSKDKKDGKKQDKADPFLQEYLNRKSKKKRSSTK